VEYTPDQVRSLIDKHGSQRQAALALGVPESTLRLRLSEGRPIRISTIPDPRIDELLSENEALKRRVYDLQIKSSKPRVIPGKDGKATKIVAIGDTHDAPGQNKDRFKWLARYCMDQQPDRIVHIGDLADWSSVSSHEFPGSVAHAARPRFKDDLESVEEAMCAFYKEIGDWQVPMDITCGNHEDRITRFENKTPETYGSLYSQFEECASRYRWRLHNYGSWLFIDGVGFTHVPHTILGKPFGGQTDNTIANAATFSLVYGHTHRTTFRRVPKIGPAQSIEILNLGSAMPDGYIAKYAGTAMTGWTYGAWTIRVRDGHIISQDFIDMQELQYRYEN
jgi:hypothetical protein